MYLPCRLSKGRVIFSAPEAKAKMHYCDQALSVVRLSILNLSYFRFLLKNRLADINKLGRKQELNVFYQVFISGRWV